MHTTLEKANRAIAAALQTGSELGVKPLTVAILDPGGHLISLQRQDGSSTLRPQIAIAKASGALAMGVSSRLIGEMAGERPTFIASLGPISPHGIVPAAGGVIIAAEDGTALGAIGVTGDTSDNDEICAFAGIAAIK
ncbi:MULTISPECIES: GlcG/HbpS family heme-binding protein [Sphingobium]|uniref:GlcG/HbpS family heme-binding protein n=1 Tax=Sphingobium TaxID=165695 RepID=UPI00159CAB65|nr:heme-binding protein [Sphingobium sp. 15-1]